MIQYCSKIEVSSDILNWWQNRLCAGISLVPGKGNKKMNSIKEKRNLGTKNKTKMALLWPYLTYTGLNAETRLVFFFFFFCIFYFKPHIMISMKIRHSFQCGIFLHWVTKLQICGRLRAVSPLTQISYYFWIFEVLHFWLVQFGVIFIVWRPRCIHCKSLYSPNSFG